MASAPQNPLVVLVDVRPYARLEPAELGPGSERRVRLRCHRRCTNRRGAVTQYTLRLDQGWLVDTVARLDGRGELLLGVHV
jgi:hypothetical protein